MSILRSARRVDATVPGAVGTACPVSSPVVRRALRPVRVVLCFPHGVAPEHSITALRERQFSRRRFIRLCLCTSAGFSGTE